MASRLGPLFLALLALPAEAQVPDGGPGGACLSDGDCGFCGWVCGQGRALDGGEIMARICLPAMEGDPGTCGSDTDCLCAGQHCSASHCTPPAKPECACNGDCPDGQVCDQLLFTCHPQSTDSCGTDYHGYEYGPQSTGPACGCNSICTGNAQQQAICQPQQGWFPPECSSDMDCGACYQGWVCVLGSGPIPGLGACQNLRDAGWCSGPRDVSPSSSGGVSTGSSTGGTSLSTGTGSTGSGASSSGGSSGLSSGSSGGGSTASSGATATGGGIRQASGGSEGCGCGSRQPGSLESLGFVVGCCLLGLRRRR